MDWTDYSDPKSAFDLVINAVKSTHMFDVYNGQRKFIAMALTRAEPLSTVEGAAHAGAKYIFKGRIIDEYSPHWLLPDPCLLSEAGDAAGAINAIHQHTTFIGYADPSSGPRFVINPGDLVEVELTKGFFSYNLENGLFTRVMQTTGVEGQQLSNAACANVALTFSAMPGYNPSGPPIPGVFTSGPLPEGQYRVSSPYQARRCGVHPTCKAHRGTDYAAVTGTKVFAVADGKVVRAVKTCKQIGSVNPRDNCGGGWGNVVVIEHTAKTPQGEVIYSVYAHLSSNIVVPEQSVKGGDQIGNVGTSGASTGPHLHFEIHLGGFGGKAKRVDPQQYLTDLPATSTQEKIEEEYEESASAPPGDEGDDWVWIDESVGSYRDVNTGAIETLA